MDTPGPGTADNPIPPNARLAAMPVETFVAGWLAITGEPPAVMLSSRAAMIALLVESMLVVPLEPPTPTWNDNGVAAGTLR